MSRDKSTAPTVSRNPISAALRRVTARLTREMADGKRSHILSTHDILGVLEAVATELDTAAEIGSLVASVADDLDVPPHETPNPPPAAPASPIVTTRPPARTPTRAPDKQS